MVATVSKTAVVRLDHGVMPSNELGSSLAFFLDVMGARFERLVGANRRGLDGTVPMLAFFTLANHHGFGVALQQQPIPAPVRPMEGPIWGFEVDERGIGAAMDSLKQREVPFEGPVEYAAPSPIAASLFLRDPHDYMYELSVRRDPHRSTAPGQGVLGLRRISHVRLEVTDLALARQWYTEVLELEPIEEAPGDRQVTLAIAATGQLFILREVAELTQRSLFYRGPHVDVKIPAGAFDTVASRIANPERYQGPVADRIPWPEANHPTVYFYDPFFNRLQMSEDRPHH